MTERNDKNRIDSDRFWDLGVQPKRKRAQTGSYDTSTAEITVTPLEKQVDEITADERTAEHPTGAPIPPRTAAARRHGGSRKPGDVRPRMAEPVCQYVPEHSLIKSVSILRWPAKYQFFEKFIADAERYFTRTAARCEYVSFYAYMPQYSQMSPAQLQWYLYWRDNVRHGIYLQTDYSYLFLYLYEIINLPKRIPPEKGISQICDIWLHYRENFSRLDRYLGEWLCDYCLVHQLPAPLDRLAPILPEISDKVSLKEFYIRMEDYSACPFTPSLIEMLTNYNWKTSHSATAETKKLFSEHLYAAVLETLSAAWQESGDTHEQFGLAEVSQTRDAFSGALCSYACKRRIDLTYISFSRSYPLKFLITDLCKLSENCIRAALGIKSRLSTSNVPEGLRLKMLHYYEKHLPPKKVSKPKKPDAEVSEEYAHFYEPTGASLSVENALAIEQASWATAELLTRASFQTEGETEGQTLHIEAASDEKMDIPSSLRGKEENDSRLAIAGSETAISPNGSTPLPAEGERDIETVAPVHLPRITEAEENIADSTDPFDRFIASLGEREYAALKCIVSGEESEYRAICDGEFLLPDAMAERINGKAVDSFGDIAAESDGTFYHLSDYYANEITEAILKQEEKNGLA